MSSSTKAIPVVTLALLFAVACEPAPDFPPEAEILWDEWAVPHVYAASEEELARGLGWAQMEAHGEAVLRRYAVARGEGALHYGEELFELDRYHHTVGLPEVARQWEEAQRPGFRAILEGFVRGINGWAEEHRDVLSEEARSVLPVTVRDVLARGIQVLYFYLVTSPGQLQSQSELWKRLPPGGEADGAGAAAAERTLPPAPGASTPLAASNAWAVGPERTRDGNALLLVNPHEPWPDPRNPGMTPRFFELHLTGPRGSFYGAILIGLPVPAVGFNQHLGRTHTVNRYDGADFYRVPLAEDGEGYLLDGETMPFAEDTARVGVRGQDGEREERTFAVRRTVHGPVVTEEHQGEVLALRVAGLEGTGALDQWWEMSWSRSLSDFEAVLRRMHLPIFNVLYADRDGNILKFYNGLVPRRPHGDWSWWQVPVDGSRSETLWDDYHNFDELPRVLNPETGWLQNANEPPWLVTRPSPLDPDAFPAYLAPRDLVSFRAQASKRLLMEAGELTLEEMDRLRADSRSEAAHRLLDGLVEAARAHGGETAREAADVLEDWDRRYRPESRGAALFYRALWQYLWDDGLQAHRAGAEAETLRELQEAPPESRFLYEEPYDPDAEAFTTPRGLARPGAAVDALEAAARELEERGVALDAPWGEAVRMRLGDTDLPAHGGSTFETFRVLLMEPDPDGGYRVAGGDTFILLVEFGDEPRGRALLTYGNASRPGFEYGHGGDQLEAYLEGRTREVLFRRGAVEAAAVKRVRLGERRED